MNTVGNSVANVPWVTDFTNFSSHIDLLKNLVARCHQKKEQIDITFKFHLYESAWLQMCHNTSACRERVNVDFCQWLLGNTSVQM